MANKIYKNVAGVTNMDKIDMIAKVNASMIHIAWKSDLSATSKMKASAKKAGIKIVKVSSTALALDIPYEHSKEYNKHEHTGNWQERVQCAAKGIVKHKTTGKLYVQGYPQKSKKDGSLLNPIRTKYYLNGKEVSKEEVEPYLNKSSHSELGMVTIPLDNVFELGKVEEDEM